tara:strand:+ start:589 stop:1824 length:1236 start_codon:yes stop_codon:yes gene_type:complete
MKNMLVISHMANIPGCCQAEWVDDRIYELIKREYNISVISATHCFKYGNQIKHYRVPSILPFEAKGEINEIESMNIDIESRPFTIKYLRFMRSVSKSLDKLNISLFKGEGRWFWMFSSLFIGLRIMPFQKYVLIYSTGGPASAHLAGIILSKIFRRKLMVELQDPLTGEGIGRNKHTIKALGIVEKFIIKKADHIIFATKNASIAAKEKYPHASHKIDYVYPGAKKLNPAREIKRGSENNKKINFSYIGSLYQTRNLDNFFRALEELSPTQTYEVNLYGWLADDILERTKRLKNDNIKIHGMIPREAAIKNAQKADVLLLVQHTDLRSSKTIPFKLYDYLNTENLIFGLTYKNDEIDDILIKHGHITSDASSVELIKKSLAQVFDKLPNKIKASKFDPKSAVDKMERIILN